VSKSAVREQFEVLRDGLPDRLATEHWATQVEDFIPARIAHLFLFDGEKVESYADLEAAPGLIGTAIQNLLGLDIVERLAEDLGSLERRHRASAKPPAEQKMLENLRDEAKVLEGSRLALAQRRAALGNTVDRLRQETSGLEDQYRREGGTLFEQRIAKEAELSAAEAQLDHVRRALRDAATGATPLLLVQRLLRAVMDRDAGEEEARRSRETVSALAAEHAAFLAHPTLQTLTTKQRKQLATAMASRLKDREAAASLPPILALESGSRAILHGLIASELPTARSDLDKLVKQEAKLRARLDELKAEIAAIPSYDAIAAVEQRRDAARAALRQAEADYSAMSVELEQLEQSLSGLQMREKRAIDAEALLRFASEDAERMVAHAEKVKATLGRFREAVVVRHVERIQALVLDSFRQLARKRSLVTELTIDPVTFALDLRGGGGLCIAVERLSAGERQLLAIAILWGLARASGRPLPTVIDTPLGRLDSQHRDHLVRRYFPHASHQVLLLSTDEEITGTYYKALRPSIGRQYRLSFDEKNARTVVEPGYFENISRELSYAD
jgi:DNA sulfur modification protein DndD